LLFLGSGDAGTMTKLEVDGGVEAPVGGIVDEEEDFECIAVDAALKL